MSLHDVDATFRFGTPLPEASGAVILLHGRGASADDIAGLADSLPMDETAFLAPEATQSSWYPQRFYLPTDENEPHLSDALALVDTLVAKLQNHGIPTHRIGIVGFSQGGCLALEYAVRHPKRYGLIAGLSSALIGPMELERDAINLENTPVLVACAQRDPHIPLSFVEKSITFLKTCHADLTSMIFPGDGHWVYPQEMDWLNAQMKEWQ